MNRSVGERLRAERMRRGLTVEEVARVTRMRPEQVRDLEDNDYGNFPSLVYAKSFLKLYGRFLKVDLADAYEFFGPEPSTFESSGLFREPLGTLESGRRSRAPARSRGLSRRATDSRSPGPGLFLWVLGILLLGGTLMAAKVAIDLSRLSTSASEVVTAQPQDSPLETEPPAASGPLRLSVPSRDEPVQEAEPVATAEPLDPNVRRAIPSSTPANDRRGNVAQ
ncbi:MAG: helix-turn-helix domain-containing protein [Verrucomicrobiia bacterium]